MLRNLIAKFERTTPPPPSPRHTRDDKKKLLQRWASKTGVTWNDVENLVFWKDPRISLAVFIIITGLFWKIVSTKLQKFGLVVIATCIPCSFTETRSYLWYYLGGRVTNNVDQNATSARKSLGFNSNDVFECLADGWMEVDAHCDYLVELKRSSPARFYLILTAYVTLFVIILAYFPVAGMCYFTFTLLYFTPVLIHLDVFNVFFRWLHKLTSPFVLHWSFSETKRSRNRARRQLLSASSSTKTKKKADSDIENEEFIPLKTKESDKVLENVFRRKSSASDDDDDDNSNDDFDEFQLRGDFHKKSQDHSSDYDEDSFLPSYDIGGGVGVSEMPSMSHFDSMMEPLEDEFHTGLDFKNITATSFMMNENSNFGIPSDHDDVIPDAHDVDVTSEDIDDIPSEDLDSDTGGGGGGRKVSEERLFNVTTNEKTTSKDDVQFYKDLEFDVDQEFEFLDRTELYDVTDEEVMEQNFGN